MRFILLIFIIDHKQAANIEPEASAIHDGEYQLTKNEFSRLGRGKYSGTTINVAYVSHYNLYLCCDFSFSCLMYQASGCIHILCCLDSHPRGL